MILNLTDKELQHLLDTHSSYAEIISTIGYKSNSGYLSKMLGEKVKHLDKTEFNKNRIDKFKIRLKRTDDNLFIANGKYSDRGTVKRRYLELVTYECDSCNISEWNNKPLVLELDHINGINIDNRLENIRLLCPNCHSQTSTYSGRNVVKNKTIYFCECGNKKIKSSKRCKDCSSLELRKIDWPTVDEMTTMVWTIPTSQLSKKLGVSDASIAKFCKKNNISKPPRGYWTKGA